MERIARAPPSAKAKAITRGGDRATDAFGALPAMVHDEDSDDRRHKSHDPLEEREDRKGEREGEGEEEDRIARALDALNLGCGLAYLSLEAVAAGIADGSFHNVIVMTGAGISVAAGIPDFRTPGTGLYDNLQKYDLPHETAVFELDYFLQNPKPFFDLAKELYPGKAEPTICHHFLCFLERKGKLLRNYTQNIDGLETRAGVPPGMVVEAHGSFATAHCVHCGWSHHPNYVKDAVFKDAIPRCCRCSGTVKPDIIFFGEELPVKYHALRRRDFGRCDLLIVIGTSLVVHPFAGLIDKVGPRVPRLLINRESVEGFRFSRSIADGGRDIRYLGDCQEAVLRLVQLCGWEAEFAEHLARFPTRRCEC